jgi:hypothetical protein
VSPWCGVGVGCSPGGAGPRCGRGGPVRVARANNDFVRRCEGLSEPSPHPPGADDGDPHGLPLIAMLARTVKRGMRSAIGSSSINPMLCEANHRGNVPR